MSRQTNTILGSAKSHNLSVGVVTALFPVPSISLISSPADGEARQDRRKLTDIWASGGGGGVGY